MAAFDRDHSPVERSKLVEAVFGDDHGGARSRERSEDRNHGARAILVELRERLIEHEQARTHRQDAGEREALALAPGKRGTARPRRCAMPVCVECLADALRHRCRRHGDVLEPERDVTLHGRIHGLQLGVLKHESDLGGEHPRCCGDDVVPAAPRARPPTVPP